MVKVCQEEYEKNSRYNEYFEEFSFELSDFQKYAIEAIVTGNHCLVTAHTGSGKTLPAEFAIRYMTNKKKKIIYTSPIKALSNQKFYDFKNKFPDLSIGLFTGDIKTNPEADVLIMTTEILMNYLFNMNEEESERKHLDFQIDITNELGCVVFDEVHYINDEHRGEVWEKTILMLPLHIQMIMLSATIESPEKFAKWCEKESNEKIVYLCSTDKRVVPLGHYSYITNLELFYKKLKDKDLENEIKKSTNKIIEIQSANGKFNEENVDKIKNILDLTKKKDIYLKKSFVINNLCKHLKENEMLPAIVFIFSRKQVESTANEITTNLLEDDSKVPYMVKKECDIILRKLPNGDEYMNLPEYIELVKLLEKGIGIHHSGMIPVLKEIVELMISKKYIKLLFATESFAIGLDCPIKTAIFPSLKKFDGNGLRELHAHEYTQMAGRAGRRGLDKIGYVVHCNNLFEMPFKSNYKRIMGGVPQTLVSKYHISYSLILNLIKNDKSEELINFSKKTMMNDRINKFIVDRKKEYDRTYEYFKETMEKKYSTEESILKEYSKYIDKFQNSRGNQQKKINKLLDKMENENKNIRNDYNIYVEQEEVKIKLNTIQQEINLIEKTVYETTNNICSLLKNEKYIELNDDKYILTEKGKACSNINEINNMVFTNVFIKTKKFEKYSDIEIISGLSFLTDVKTSIETKTSVANYLNRNIEEIVKSLDFELNGYIIVEGNYNIYNSGVDYEEKNYDVPNMIEGWINCENEEECKIYLKEIINEHYQVMTGEFVKVLLKLCAVNKEILNMCLNMNYIELANKMQNIESKILKYVVTPQSLYL
tara:strand:+ start:526 stop:3000 length:2475 start_codon:yes stop_codon:yes gene_type:complete